MKLEEVLPLLRAGTHIIYPGPNSDVGYARARKDDTDLVLVRRIDKKVLCNAYSAFTMVDNLLREDWEAEEI